MSLFRSRYVTNKQLAATVAELDGRIDLMATQADVDVLTASVTKVSADIANAKTTLQAEIDKLATANPALDLTSLQAAVALLDPAVLELGNLTPTPPPPPPPPPVTGTTGP